MTDRARPSTRPPGWGDPKRAGRLEQLEKAHAEREAEKKPKKTWYTNATLGQESGRQTGGMSR